MAYIKPFDVKKKSPTHSIIAILGGDNDLNNYIEKDMQEMLAGMSEDMSVLCLVDYIDKSAEVVELTRVEGKILIESGAEWGELNTGDPEKLAEFLARALATYSGNTKIAIGFWSHGTGIFDEGALQKREVMTRPLEESRKKRIQLFRHLLTKRNLSFQEIDTLRYMLDNHTSDDEFYDKARRTVYSMFLKRLQWSMFPDNSSNGILTNQEAGRMLASAIDRRKVSMIFSDTCLNGMVEVMHEFAEYAEVIVASEDKEPGDGWNYKLWFEKMAAEPPNDSKKWAKQAIDAFGEAYANKTEFYPCTLGAFTTDHSLARSFKELIDTIDAHGRKGWHWMRDAREITQSFSMYASYDLLDFTENLKKILEDGADAEAVKEKVDALASALRSCRVHSVALGDKVRNSHGLSFWFPYEKAIFMKDVESYSGLSFDIETGWTKYLKKYYLVE